VLTERAVSYMLDKRVRSGAPKANRCSVRVREACCQTIYFLIEVTVVYRGASDEDDEQVVCFVFVTVFRVFTSHFFILLVFVRISISSFWI